MPDRINVPDQPGYDQVFRSQNGLLGRDLQRRVRRVESAARRQARVRTGALRSRIHSSWIAGGRDRLAMRVGSDVDHALVHHEGARPHVIRPRNAKAMRYVNKQGDVVFAQQVSHPGTRPNRYLADNLPLAIT